MSTYEIHITLPDFTLVPASAGAGKTTALTRRFLRLLMTEGLPHNDLRNILAITFTKNAATEMKERILETLKRAALSDPAAVLELQEVLPLEDDALPGIAGMFVETILDNYSDVQVQTIDSFITRVLKASATELGLPPEFDVDFNVNIVLDEALDLFAREIAADPAKQQLLGQLIDLISEQQHTESRYLWNPLEKIAKEVRTLYLQLSAHTGEPVIVQPGARLQELRKEILARLQAIGELGAKSGLVISKRYADIIDLARAGNIDGIIGRKLDQNVLNKPQGDYDAAAAARVGTLQREIVQLTGEYLHGKALTYYLPYLQAYRMMQSLTEQVKRRRGAVFLGEANRSLAQMLDAEVVPEIYFSLGEQVHHFLIDEFQDTAPIQWAVLHPLIEHSLGGRGSLFIVGDTKQSIYTFRGADWRIMRRMMERDEFPSVPTQKLPLTTNYRSAEKLVEFTKDVFHRRVPIEIHTDVSDLSGLASYRQQVQPDKQGMGYVELHIIEPPASDEEKNQREENPPERDKLLAVLNECRARGYALGDIAILTPRNADVVEVSRWLNAEQIKFLSHSSLDIRTRTITGELLALLRFLDSPVDNHAFATFLLSRIFGTTLEHAGVSADVHAFLLAARSNQGRTTSLYSIFREQHPDVWEKYFERLFTLVGYLPLYDLVVEAYNAFNLFATQTDEEATLVKFLEVVKDFEENGNNSLKDFLRYAEEDGEENSDEWEIATAESEDAIRVMTVHKAKGLGFPVLITLFYDRVPRTPSRFIVGEGEGVQLLHLTKDWAEKSPELKERYEESRILTQVDDLNKLYVALTRAREEMYVICVKQRRGNQPSVFLPSDGYTSGKRLQKQRERRPAERHSATAHIRTRGLPLVTVFEPLKLRETQRGEFIHRVLSDIEFLGADVEKAVAAAIERRKHELRGEFAAVDVTKTILEFLQLPAVAGYFVPLQGRTVLNEQEVVDSSGALHRIDRLVVDAETVTVLDYKTGEENESYSTQVQEYMGIVRTMYPGKTVRGVLLYVDRKTVQEVA